jgi:hypothetical protein
MGWQDNPIMEWSLDGTTWTKISDHGRSPLDIAIERIENKQRMADGRLRRYVVGKKRSFSCSWDNMPSKATSFLANGQAGDWLEDFHNTVNGSFKMRLRAGSDVSASSITRNGTENDLDNERVFDVMISDFTKQIIKRGPAFDLWSLDITLEEV